MAGSVLRVAFAAIGLALGGSVGSAPAQYLLQPAGYPPSAYYSNAAGQPRNLGAYHYSVVPPSDPGSAVAALPSDYEPELGPAQDLPPRFHRTVIEFYLIYDQLSFTPLKV